MADKKMYTKKLGSRVAVSAKPLKSGRYHVIIGDNQQWNVVADGSKRATKVFPTRLSAIEFAKETAYKAEGEVIIHKKTGEVEDRVSLAK